MHEVPGSLYNEAQLTLLLREVSHDGTYAHVVADLALVLRHADPQTVPATLVPALARAVLASVDPQRAVNQCVQAVRLACNTLSARAERSAVVSSTCAKPQRSRAPMRSRCCCVNVRKIAATWPSSST